MDSQSLKTILSKRFSEQLQDLRPDVFKVVSKYKDRDVAVHYFDCSKTFLSEDFDLFDYQRNLLGKDYYSSSGPLQWNYYLYFVTDSETLPFDKKLKIESDKSYSRKIVTTQEELLKLIEVQSKLKTQSKPLQSNALLTVWKGKLKAVGLASVYLAKEFPKPSDVYQQFVNGDKIEEREETSETASNETKVEFLKLLTIKHFRCFKDESFKFSKVNLISGVNGTGKTSLLEAIELCLCGQTIENSKTENFEVLDLNYLDGSKDSYTPENNKKFQARDRAWYGNNTLRGNSLSEGFHIYNFFDSDAAFRFSNESNSGEKIQEIFARIILGEETNIIFDRISRLHDRLNSELKQLNENLKSSEVQIADYQTKIRDFDSGAVTITTLSEIITSLDNLGWRGTNLLLSEGSNRKEFNEELTKVVNFINNAFALFRDGEFTDELIHSENKLLEEITLEYNELNKSTAQIIDQLNEASKSQRVLENKMKVFDNASKYYLEDKIGSIKGLSQRTIHLNRSVQNIVELKRLTSTLSLEEDQTLDNLNKDQYEKLIVFERDLAKSRAQISELEKSLGTLKKLKSDLKRIGLEHIRLSNNSHECPLCQTDFKEGELIVRIESAETELNDEELLATLSRDIERLENQVSATRSNIDNIQKIKENIVSGEGLSGLELESLRVTLLVEKLNALMKEFDQEVKQLESLNVRFQSNNLKELELNQINNNLLREGINLSLGINTKDEFVKTLEELKNKLNAEIEKQSGLNKQRFDLEQNLITRLASYLKETSVDKNSINSYFERIRETKAKVEITIQSKESIHALIPIEKLTNLGAIKLEIENIQKLFDRYLELESTNKLRKEYTDRITVLNSSIESIKASLAKYKAATSVLTDLINVNNPKNFLQDFFRENKQSILDIFKSIHLPNEFDDIQFESADVIKLKVKNSTENRDLTEVSTGQKSAFILSLYLTLNNNLKSGPPLMIFDDPVAYVDDINTLSFLDFLRERVLAMDRQIFFATANSKLANLFQQKFDFLGDDFEVIKLKKIIA